MSRTDQPLLLTRVQRFEKTTKGGLINEAGVPAVRRGHPDREAAGVIMCCAGPRHARELPEAARSCPNSS